MSATKRTITSTVDEKLLADVERLRRARCWSRSFVVSEALRDFVSRAERQIQEETGAKQIRDDIEPVTDEDLRAIRDGRKDVSKRRTVRIEDLIDELDRRDCQPRPEGARRSAKKRA